MEAAISIGVATVCFRWLPGLRQRRFEHLPLFVRLLFRLLVCCGSRLYLEILLFHERTYEKLSPPQAIEGQ